MITINNADILTIGNNCDCSTFVPTIAGIYAPTATVPNIIFTDSSTVPSSDNFKSAVITVHDSNGGRKYGRIANTGTGNVLGTVTISTGITAVALTTAGSGYCGGGNGNLNIAFTGGTGSGGTAYCPVIAGVPQTPVITNAGTYSVAPTSAAVVVKSSVIILNTSPALVLAPSPISINANLSTWGGAVTTGVKACEGDVYMYGINAAGTYTIGDTADERDLDSVTDTE